MHHQGEGGRAQGDVIKGRETAFISETNASNFSVHFIFFCPYHYTHRYTHMTVLVFISIVIACLRVRCAGCKRTEDTSNLDSHCPHVNKNGNRNKNKAKKNPFNGLILIAPM